LRSPEGKASSIVACYIGAAYWFTASTSFTKPPAAFDRYSERKESAEALSKRVNQK
jgi:hypothetical protein